MNKIESVFVLGIGGSGMSSIAKYLAQKKMKVEGYDQRKSYITNQLEQDGVKVIFDIDNFVYSPKTLYVYSSAIPINDTFLKNLFVLLDFLFCSFYVLRQSISRFLFMQLSI